METPLFPLDLELADEKQMKNSKAQLQRLVLETLDSCPFANNRRRGQLCGIWLIGAVDTLFPGETDPNLSTSPKKSKSKTTDEDDYFLNGLLSFVAKGRSETELQNIWDNLNDTTRCYCSESEDPTTTVEDFTMLHYHHELGFKMIDTLRDLGHFLPVTGLHNRLNPLHSQNFPRSFTSLRSHRSPASPYLHIHPYLPPMQRPHCAPIAECAVTYLFEVLASRLEERISLSFSKGRSNSWPYSPREFMLLIQQRASPATPPTDDIEACASILMCAVTQWTHWMLNTSPTNFLTNIIRMCGTLIVPAMVKCAYSLTTLLDLAKFIIDSSLNVLRRIDNAEPSVCHFVHRKETGFYVLRQCQRVAVFYMMSINGHGVPLQWNNTMVPSECRRMAQLFTMMVYLLEDSRVPFSVRNSPFGEGVKGTLRPLCATYYSMARFVSSTSPTDLGMVCHPLLAQYYKELQGGQLTKRTPTIESNSITHLPGKRENFLNILPAVRKRPYCCAWGCSKSVQEAGAEFKACSACNLVKYCGRTCQKLDWKGFYQSGEPFKDPQLRHAYICSLLKRFNTYSKDTNAIAEDVVLEDEEWLKLSAWRNGIYPLECAFPDTPAVEELDSPEDSTGNEKVREWKDFYDILVEFVVLANAPEPIFI
ncbi:hypothetical protein CPB83DRAFT_855023 [Crepidotus variabilis]|uniref:MYND-type domain-containing protein n=1 Tax=Crepidotus variabilis TaxID=179855 RepID=A0A9P6EFK6_9AGAR|nr:hypothetical protein CPB83DRAFT_855023 [Crepidotus variabilis]